MNIIASSLGQKRVKTWIYVILVIQCCLLFAYVTIFHGASSRTYDTISDVTTDDKKRKAADVDVRRLTTQSARPTTSGQARDQLVHGIDETADVNHVNVEPRDITVFTVPQTFKPDAKPHVKDDKTASNVTVSEHNGALSLVPSPGYEPDVGDKRGENQTVIKRDSNSSVIEPGELMSKLTVLYQNYSTIKLNFSGNLKPTLGLNTPHGFVLRNTSLSPLFTRRANTTCLALGTTDMTSNASDCSCKPGWFGARCTVPETVQLLSGIGKYVEGLQVRKTPRRIINAVSFNIEFDLLEARLHELWDLVDVFVILESSYSHYGEPKPLRLLDRLLAGYLQKYHSKICYLLQPSFPEGARENGWVMDQHHRTYIGKVSMQHMAGIRPDDIYIYTDADEIPSRESILFLKIHDGYPEPFGVSLRWSVYGFFWKQFDTTKVMIGCTVGMLRYVFQNDVYKIRANSYRSQEAALRNYIVSSGSLIYDWHIADQGGYAGWHCSWCLPPEGIRVKLTSAINADFPRWGSFPEKRELTYIKELIRTGTWFDDKTTFGTLVSNATDEYLAPRYLLANFDKYKHILDISYAG